MGQWDKMLKGELYTCDIFDEKMVKEFKNKGKFLDKFNKTKTNDYKKRNKLITKYFGHVGKDCYINKPFYCDYGINISLGDNFYANYDCIFLDVAKINIGNNVFLAPRVCIYTATHPIDKDIRNSHLEYGKEVNIGSDVWIGGNTVINPGVTIGDNVVIGSNSVVTKDLPSNSICAGNPCKIIRSITEEDKIYWYQKAKEFFESIKIK